MHARAGAILAIRLRTPPRRVKRGWLDRHEAVRSLRPPSRINASVRATTWSSEKRTARRRRLLPVERPVSSGLQCRIWRGSNIDVPDLNRGRAHSGAPAYLWQREPGYHDPAALFCGHHVRTRASARDHVRHDSSHCDVGPGPGIIASTSADPDAATRGVQP